MSGAAVIALSPSQVGLATLLIGIRAMIPTVSGMMTVARAAAGDDDGALRLARRQAISHPAHQLRRYLL